jgi:plastocyanin
MRSTHGRSRRSSSNIFVLTRFAFRLVSAFVATAAPATAAVVHVDVAGIAFVPATIKAHVGDTVEWTNKDFVAHSATARSSEWDVNLPVHQTGHITLKKAGGIDYYCRIHPNMKGKIEVSPK